MSRDTKKDVGTILKSSGVSFRVWAPFASAVAVTGSFNDWSHTPMESEGDGYWSILVKKAKAGQEYKFVITNGQNQLYKNDPRSLQVTTTAGNSVIVDTSFDWEDDKFRAPNFNEQVIYELHVGTFNRADPSTTGTFADAVEKLDYLADLGVNMIEIMPISSMSMDRGWGYATDYIYAVESLYGGRHEFLELVKAAHKKGIGVVLDVVYNHFGPDNNLDLWQFDGWGQDGKGGIYFYNDWRAQTPWGETRPDFGRAEVRQYIIDNVSMWMQDCHLDGLRVDSTIYMRNVRGHNDDPSTDIPDGWGMLQQISAVAQKINPYSVVIAEDVGGNHYVTKPTREGGAGFSAQWEVTFPNVLRGVLDAIDDADRSLSAIGNILGSRYNVDVFERVVYSDSHDSAANGNARLNEEISPGHATDIFARRRSLLAASIVMTAPGIPMLFQGQEFMAGGSFNDWQALDWDQAEHFDGIVLANKHLIALRKNQYRNTRGLTGQSFKIIHMNDESKVLAYHRWLEGGAGDDVVVVINFANKPKENYRLDFPRPGTWRVRFNSDWRGYSPDFAETGQGEVQVEKSGAKISLGPYATLIFSQD